jgi:hypothetical protein
VLFPDSVKVAPPLKIIDPDPEMTPANVPADVSFIVSAAEPKRSDAPDPPEERLLTVVLETPATDRVPLVSTVTEEELAILPEPERARTPANTVVLPV